MATKVFEVSNMNSQMPPGQDFNEHGDFKQFAFAEKISVNGTWLKTNEIPGDYSRWGLFEQLGERNNEILRAIMDEAAEKIDSGDPTLAKAGKFWKCALDEEKLERDGIAPLRPTLDKIDSAEDIAAFFKTMAELEIEGLGHLVLFLLPRKFCCSH